MSRPEEIPQWAKERARKLATDELRETLPTGEVLAGSFDGRNVCATAFARYIAAHEEPPVDPLLIEAREIAAGYNQLIGDKVRGGQFDGTDHVCIAHAGLRRGIELGQSK